MGKNKVKLTPEVLRKKKVPQVLIPGLILAAALGFTGWTKLGRDYTQNKTVFPETGIVQAVIDGDTFQMKSGVMVRLVGVDAPNRGEAGEEAAKRALLEMVVGRRVYLEYDRYQDDKYGRVLAWVWLGCESKPKFTPFDYMRLTYNRSRPGLMQNPDGCLRGELVQEELVRQGKVKVEEFKDRGELKYSGRLGDL